MRRALACLMLAAGLAGFAGWARAEDSVVFKLLAVNPSETDAKEVTLRGVLPPEVKPENVLDTDGLEVVYDAQLGAHVVTGRVTLKPKESIVRNVLIENVWIVAEEQFDRLAREVDDILRKLVGTPFLDRGQLIASAIRRRVGELREHQRAPVVDPENHISRYREDLKGLQMVESEMVSLRQLMVMAALEPSRPGAVLSGGAGTDAAGRAHERGSLSILTTWRIVFIILALLGVLSLSFFFIWQRQLRLQLARQAEAERTASSSDDPFTNGGNGGTPAASGANPTS